MQIGDEVKIIKKDFCYPNIVILKQFQKILYDEFLLGAKLIISTARYENYKYDFLGKIAKVMGSVVFNEIKYDILWIKETKRYAIFGHQEALKVSSYEFIKKSEIPEVKNTNEKNEETEGDRLMRFFFGTK